jgi:hypothetical protein
MKVSDYAKNYYNTNNTYIKVEDLGQLIALSIKKLQWAAKPSEIFLNKHNHDLIFNDTVPNYPRDMILLNNLYHAMRRGLQKYIQMPAQMNDSSQIVFNKPIVKAYIFYIATLFYYQMPQKDSIRRNYSIKLYKIANSTLVVDFENFYTRYILKVKNWYMTESNNLGNDVSQKSLDNYFAVFATELGINLNGAIPFSSKAM